MTATDKDGLEARRQPTGCSRENAPADNGSCYHIDTRFVFDARRRPTDDRWRAYFATPLRTCHGHVAVGKAAAPPQPLPYVRGGRFFDADRAVR